MTNGAITHVIIKSKVIVNTLQQLLSTHCNSCCNTLQQLLQQLLSCNDQYTPRCICQHVGTYTVRLSHTSTYTVRLSHTSTYTVRLSHTSTYTVRFSHISTYTAISQMNLSNRHHLTTDRAVKLPPTWPCWQQFDKIAIRSSTHCRSPVTTHSPLRRFF